LRRKGEQDRATLARWTVWGAYANVLDGESIIILLKKIVW
jgi:hypothetical protein